MSERLAVEIGPEHPSPMLRFRAQDNGGPILTTGARVYGDAAVADSKDPDLTAASLQQGDRSRSVKC
jgi:hypothetical protein